MSEAPSGDGHGPDLYLDAIEEALARARPGKRSRAMRGRVSDVAIRQMRLVEKLQRQLSHSIRIIRGQVCDACGHNKPIPPEQMLKISSALNEITTQIEKLARSIRESAKSEREAFGDLDPETWKHAFSAELARNAKEIVAEDRKMLLHVWFGADVAEVLTRGRAA